MAHFARGHHHSHHRKEFQQVGNYSIFILILLRILLENALFESVAKVNAPLLRLAL